MNPAFSVIFFTTLTGAGYGMLMIAGTLAFFGRLPADRGFGIVFWVLALGSISVGLLASLFHLGHPERAWRSLSQWRSSWLSREGVAAMVTYVPAVIFAWGWIVEGNMTGVWGIAGLAAAAVSLVTVYCTAHIYRSLTTIDAWANGYVLPGYLILSLASGGLWLNALAQLFGADIGAGFMQGLIIALFAAIVIKIGYWGYIDSGSHPSTPESATGMPATSRVSEFAAPHTQTNYLLEEMGFRIGRKHGDRLRQIAAVAMFVVPVTLLVLAIVISQPGLSMIFSIVAAVSATLGIIIERWLFFAQARHVVTLYYGAPPRLTARSLWGLLTLCGSG